MGHAAGADQPSVLDFAAARPPRVPTDDGGPRSPRHRTLAPAVSSVAVPQRETHQPETQDYLHDVRHQVATVVMLASALDVRTGRDAESRALTGHLITESRRLDDLVASMARHPSTFGVAATAGRPPAVRLDELVSELTEPFRPVVGPSLQVLVTAAVVRHDPLLLWRALRNLVDNARAAAGPTGHVDVRLFIRDGFAVVDVDDDGPGLPDGAVRGDGRGLTIVDALARGWAGWLELSSGPRGGCRARLHVPLWRGDAGQD